MLWTFDETVARPLDKVRVLIGDTDINDQLLDDGSITFALATQSNVYRAAAEAAGMLASLAARDVTFKAGQLSVNLSDKSKFYSDLATRLRRQAAASGTAAFAGGISVSDQTTRREDTDRLQPVFTADLEMERGTQVYPIVRQENPFGI